MSGQDIIEMIPVVVDEAATERFKEWGKWFEKLYFKALRASVMLPSDWLPEKKEAYSIVPYGYFDERR